MAQATKDASHWVFSWIDYCADLVLQAYVPSLDQAHRDVLPKAPSEPSKEPPSKAIFSDSPS